MASGHKSIKFGGEWKSFVVLIKEGTNSTKRIGTFFIKYRVK